MRESFGQNLDRHVTIERRVARAKDLAHSAFADCRGDLVGSETGAGSHCHAGWIIRAGGELTIDDRRIADCWAIQ